MLKEKVIQGIEPFNELFYRTCFNNSFFPIVRRFHKSILHFLINDIGVYDYNYEKNPYVCDMRYIISRSMDSLLEEAGIAAVSKEFADDIMLTVKEGISNERPVVMWVDSFYESIRHDVYNKEHLLHTLLVYGFNEADQEFYIVEHDHKDGLTYEKRKISYNDLSNAYNGYIEFFQKVWHFPAYNEYFTTKHVVTEPSGEDLQVRLCRFKQNMLAHESELFEGLEHLKAFAEHFSTVALDAAVIDNHIQDIITGFNEVINAKILHNYIIQILFKENSGILNSFQNILDSWNFIRATVVRYMYSKIFRRNSFEAAVYKLNELYRLEHDYGKLLYSVFRNR